MSVVGPSHLPLLSAAQAAELLGIPKSTVEEYARQGRLPSVRIGRRVLFSRPALEQIVHEAITSGKPL